LPFANQAVSIVVGVEAAQAQLKALEFKIYFKYRHMMLDLVQTVHQPFMHSKHVGIL
jgi:hypothetical protein